jgi:hypothetical protein
MSDGTGSAGTVSHLDVGDPFLKILRQLLAYDGDGPPRQGLRDMGVPVRGGTCDGDEAATRLHLARVDVHGAHFHGSATPEGPHPGIVQYVVQQRHPAILVVFLVSLSPVRFHPIDRSTV